MLSHLTCYIVILGALVVGCENSRHLPDEDHDSQGIQKPDFSAGDIDKEGRLVIYAAAKSYAYLETDYALIFRSVTIGGREVPQYDFSSGVSGFESFTDLDLLVKRLEQIPGPRTVDLYSTCGGPPWQTLPKAQIDHFFDQIENAGVELRHERPNGSPNTICTCPW